LGLAPRAVPTLSDVRLPRLSPTAYRNVALATLVSLVVITVVGAGVRLTGSGLGCSTWPSCEPGSFTPRSASDGHAMIEFANRLLNATIGLLTIAAVAGARLRRPYRPDLFRWALALFAWVLSNGLVGALVVWLHLSPVSVIGHFVLSLGAIWNGLVLYRRADDGHAEEPEATAGPHRYDATPAFVAASKGLLVAVTIVLLSGTVVTGSGPHAGDDRADRLDLEVGTVARLHGLAMIAFLVLTIAVVRMAHRGDAAPRVAQRGHELLVVLVAQAVLGYWQYFAGVPELLVAFHVLGAAFVWIAVLRLWMSLPADDASHAAWQAAGHRDPAAAPTGPTGGDGRRSGAVAPSATP
jgi:cytochrome c oxidase assembly protein subunit 15